MNVVGKILVILNLLVALVVAFFIVLVNRTSTNWKKYADERDRETRSLQISLDTTKESFELERKEKNLLENKLRTGDVNTGNRVKELEGLLTAREIERDNFRQQAELADSRANKAQEEVKRYMQVAADRLDIIAKREEVINKQQAQYRELEKIRRELKDEVDRLQLRAVALQEEYRQAQKKYDELLNQGAKSNGGVTVANGARKPNGPNPPSKAVRGKIDKIHAEDRTLMQIDVGLDQGVDKNHTLEVYRLSPQPLYLGMIRIIDADFHSARARLIRAGVQGQTIREGDQVVSSLKMIP